MESDPKTFHILTMRRAAFAAVVILSLGVVGYILAVYGFMPYGTGLHPDLRSNFETHNRVFLYAHVFGAAFALALGPFQFWTRLRNSRPRLHRWTGRLYLGIGVLVGGVSALAVAFNAYGGPLARLGFASLAALWLFTGVRAYRSIRAGDIQAHRRWMTRNFSLTFAAVMLRLWLPGLVISGVAFNTAYPVIAWLCWVPNLLVAELLIMSRGRNAEP